MNTEYSDLNKRMQTQLKKKETFNDGIDTLLILRSELMKQIIEFKNQLSKEDFSAIPFINKDGFDKKTIAYSLFHIFRIEDIVANSLIRKGSQIFFDNHYQSRMNSPIQTTGNELVKQAIADFSNELNIDELYQYIKEVDSSTKQLLKGLSFEDLKIKMTLDDAENLKSLNIVSEEAAWLIDYWCSKDIKGLIQMPFSRHWISHVQASTRIRNKIKGA